MTNEDMNKAAFGIQAIAEKAGMVGFVCAFVYRDTANPTTILAGGFSSLPNLSGDAEAVNTSLRSLTEGLVTTAKENAWKAYDQHIETAALQRAKAQIAAVDASSPADPAQPDPALANE